MLPYGLKNPPPESRLLITKLKIITNGTDQIAKFFHLSKTILFKGYVIIENNKIRIGKNKINPNKQAISTKNQQTKLS